MAAAQVDLEIVQGSTFSYPLTWYSGKVMKPISAITSTAPALVTAANHGLPANPIPVTITNVKGMRIPADTLRATRVDTGQFTVDLDASGLGTYKSGGTLTYYAPVNLAGYEARMQVRANLAAADTILDLTTDPGGGITLGGSEGVITITVDAADTAALNFTSAVYDLELLSPTGVVTRLMEGKVTLKKEVTR